MGHNIRGWVAKAAPLKALASLNNQAIVPLNLGYAFLPDFDHEPERVNWPGFPIAYIKTEYFGGAGSQSARYWLDETAVDCGSSAGAPLRQPINTALQAIGVVPTGAVDPFDLVGLGQYRSMDRFERGG